MKILHIRKKNILIIIFILGLLLISVSAAIKMGDNSNHAVSNKVKKQIIVVDAGHGGFDPGTEGRNGTVEADINLCISLYLEEILKENNFTVIMTRSDENALGHTKSEDMQKRKEIIKNSDAAFVVTIHLNYYRASSIYGGQVFYETNCECGKKLAQEIQKNINSELIEGNNRKIQPRDDLAVFTASDIPSVCVECGFLSNENEEYLLKQEWYQKKIAQAIADAIITSVY